MARLETLSFGQYDQSGLAKRVAAAFDEDQQLDDLDTVYIAQTSSTVVLKGKPPSQDFLDKMVSRELMGQPKLILSKPTLVKPS